MKTNLILLCIAVSSLLMSSCEKDLLDTVPKDRLAADLYWKTEQDAIYAVNAIYSRLGSQWNYCSFDAFTDIAHFTLQWRSESSIEKNVIDASNNVVATEWARFYTLIGTANNFLENVDKITFTTAGLNARLKAEARALRADAYTSLVMLYGDVPLVVNTLTVAEAKEVTRTAASTIWDFISAELTVSAAALPTTYGSSDRGRITKGAALGLKARAMLYAGRYADAKAAALEVMNLNVYSIVTPYAQLFDYAGENSPEIMFARQYAKSLSAHSIFYFYTANSLYSSQNQATPTKPLVDAYLMKTTGLPITAPGSGFDPYNPYTNRDPRLNFTIYKTGDVLPNGKVMNSLPGSGTGDDITSSNLTVTPTGWYVRKYVSNSDYAVPTNCAVNLIYLRYAEVLLTYAEACIELGGANIDQAMLDATINKIRLRPDVLMPVVTTLNQAELREIVRRERMVELALEGLRLFDIRRWKTAEFVIPGTVKGMTYNDPANPGTLKTVELTGYIKEFNPSKHYLWPVPFNEITLNPNLLPQNPNY